MKHALYVAAEKRRLAEEAIRRSEALTLGSPGSTRGTLFGLMRPKFRMAANVVAVAGAMGAGAGRDEDSPDRAVGGEQRRNSDGEPPPTEPGSMRKKLSSFLGSSRALLRPRISNPTSPTNPPGSEPRPSIDASAQSSSRTSQDAGAQRQPAAGDDRSAEQPAASGASEGRSGSGDPGAPSAKVHPAPLEDGSSRADPPPGEGGEAAAAPPRSEPELQREEEEVRPAGEGPALGHVAVVAP